jgi:hypothetical protein
MYHGQLAAGGHGGIPVPLGALTDRSLRLLDLPPTLRRRLLGLPTGLLLGLPVDGLLALKLFPVSAVGEFPADLISRCTCRSVEGNMGERAYLRVVLPGDPFEGLSRG